MNFRKITSSMVGYTLLFVVATHCRHSQTRSTGDENDLESSLYVQHATSVDDGKSSSSIQNNGELKVDRTIRHGRQVAVTIDDLPIAMYNVYKTDEHRELIVQSLCRIVQTRSLPVTGFVNMMWHEKNPKLMERWRACGIELGNHTWSHPRLQKIGVDAFLKDIEQGHRALEEWIGKPRKLMFRYPFLFQGFRPKEREIVRAKLDELGSTHAPVTIDTWDWLYARGYTQARQEGDKRAMQRYHTSWSWNLQEATLYAEGLARELFAREPPQILLLHANEINAVFLGEYLDWLQDRGYQFISLASALQDPAYQEVDRSWSPSGDSFWLRLRRSRSLSLPHPRGDSSKTEADSNAGRWRSLPE